MPRFLLGPTVAATAILLPILAGGCAAVKATQQPSKRDVAVLNRGVPRTHVIAELGHPSWSNHSQGGTVDVFAFKQGYSKTTKAARALAHGAADVATLGLWEVVGIPVESIADGTDVQVEVHYAPDQTVERVVVIKGEKALHPPKLFQRLDRPQPESTAETVAGRLPAPDSEAGRVAASSARAVR